MVGGLILIVAAILIGLDMWDEASIQLAIPAQEAHFDGVVLAVIGAVQGLVQLVIGWIGVRGANRPSKIGPFIVLSLIATIYYAVCFGMLFAQSGFDGVCFVGTLWNAFMLLLGNNVRKDAQK